MTAAATDGAAPPADAEAQAHARAVTERSGTSFFWAMRLLPAARRDAMYAVYAFCREVDDIADDAGIAEAERLARLADWRDDVERLYAGAPRSLTCRALRPAVAAYGIPKAELLALIDGMEMDARDRIHGLTMAELELYCRRVAGAVGMMSVHVFGDGGEVARRLAVAEGEALQLTNILRDLKEDAGRDRLYLPTELLDEHGIAAREPAEVLRHPALGGVCDALAARARERYGEAAAALGRLDRRLFRPAAVMLHVYRALFDRVVARGWRRLDEPVAVAKPVKLWLALRHGLL